MKLKIGGWRLEISGVKTIKMHPDEVDTDVPLIQRLLAAQFPQWANLTICPVLSAGTDNALYRLGENLVVRLPRIHWAVGQIDKEFCWLPRLASKLPLALPVPVAKGQPGAGFPYRWGVYEWLDGQTMTIDTLTDPNQAALDLAEFMISLQKIETTGQPLPETHPRGQPLALKDDSARQAIAALDGMYDAHRLTTIWETAVAAPEWDTKPVWFHGDLLPGNLLFLQDRLTAVIDFGCLGIGDPACDLMPAWNLFSGESRALFRAALKVDDATWERGRGWALWQALVFIPYYFHTNPIGVANARRAVEEILSDFYKQAV